MFRLTRSSFIAFVLCLCGSSFASAQELSDAEKGEGFVSLFNGKDFTNWRFGDDSPPKELPKNWSVADGLIKLSGGGNPHLATAKEYGNFEFRFEWRAVKANYNSGLFLRSGKKVGANQINLAKGSEGNFINGKLKGAKSAATLQKPAGEWNEWRVLCEGENVKFWCNGQLAWEGSGMTPASGYIGIQAEGAAIDFRNLRIREIK